MTIKERCQEIKQHFLNKITLAEQTHDRAIISIVCLSILDCMAQENAKYSKGKNKKTFVNFIKKYGASDILDCVNYVTLYYECTEMFNLEGFCINNILSNGCVYTLPEIGEIFSKFNLDTIPLQQKNEHKLDSQLWYYRNKIMHEFNTISYDISDGTSWIPNNVPYFYSLSNNWVFCIPTKFIKELTIRCLKNYLYYCEECNQEPFENNNDDRSVYLSWVN